MALKGFIDWVKGEGAEDDYDDFQQETTKTTSRAVTQEPSTPAPSEPERRSYNSVARNSAPMPHTNIPAQLAVVLVKPDVFEKAAEIADHLKSRRTVVLNLEKTENSVARRLVDFLSGVAYANEGKIKRVANNTYIITPFDVDLMGEVLDELSGDSSYF